MVGGQARRGDMVNFKELTHVVVWPRSLKFVEQAGRLGEVRLHVIVVAFHFMNESKNHRVGLQSFQTGFLYSVLRRIPSSLGNSILLI